MKHEVSLEPKIFDEFTSALNENVNFGAASHLVVIPFAGRPERILDDLDARSWSYVVVTKTPLGKDKKLEEIDLRFDPSKPCQTRDGQEVRIYAIDADGIFSIHGAIKNVDGGWGSPQTWTKDGTFNLPSSTNHFWDLVNAPKPKIKQKIWIRVNKTGPPINDYYYRVRLIPPIADESTVAIIPVELEFSEGEGL